MKSVEDEAQVVVDFIHYAEKLKVELRQASKSNNDRESVAEHCWRVSLMLVLVAPKLKIRIDLLKALKMAIIHDLVEIEYKDIPILQHINNKKAGKSKHEQELKAMKKIQKMLGSSGKEVYDLFVEFEDQKTNEAKVLKALDRLEGQLQFLSESVMTFTSKHKPAIEELLRDTTECCKVDPFIQKLDAVSLKARKNRIKF